MWCVVSGKNRPELVSTAVVYHRAFSSVPVNGEFSRHSSARRLSVELNCWDPAIVWRPGWADHVSVKYTRYHAEFRLILWCTTPGASILGGGEEWQSCDIKILEGGRDFLYRRTLLFKQHLKTQMLCYFDNIVHLCRILERFWATPKNLQPRYHSPYFRTTILIFHSLRTIVALFLYI